MKVVAHLLRVVVVTDAQAGGDLGAGGAEVLADTLTRRLQSFEAGGSFDRVDADALGRAVIEGGMNGDLCVGEFAVNGSSFSTARPGAN